MKIFIAISDSFCGNFIKGQAKYLISKGHDVTIISPKGKEIDEIIKYEKCRHIEIKFSREISIINDFKSLIQVIKLLKKEKPTIVNAGNPKTGFLFTIAGIIFPKIPVLFTLRGLRSETLEGFKKKIVRFTEYLSCHLANKVIVVSPSLQKYAMKLNILPKGKGVVIGKGSSNGIDIEKFQLNRINQIKGLEIRNKYSISKSDIVVGFVGRLVKDKGVEKLYEAFKIAFSKNKNLKLILAGPLEKNDSINEDIFNEIKIDKNVILLGNQNDVTPVFAAIDMLILYSFREGFGNVVLEASSMEKPVIVSDIPGARDTVEDQKNGFLVPLNNTELLAKKILLYANDVDLRLNHGIYGAKRVRDHFRSEIIWKGQLKIYNEALNER